MHAKPSDKLVMMANQIANNLEVQGEERAVAEMHAIQTAERARQLPEGEWKERDREARVQADHLRSYTLTDSDLQRIAAS